MSGAIVDAVIRVLPSAVTAAERARVERLLTAATSEAAHVLGRTTTTPGNHAGALTISSIADAARGSELLLVTKHVQGGAEVAASQLAGMIEIDHLVPIAVRDGDDGARMLFATGESADAAGVTSAEDLVQLRMRGLELEAPHLATAERERIARMEVELAQVFDYLLANSDRRPRNLLVDRVRGTFALIDNASIGHGTMFRRHEPTRPALKPAFQGADCRTELSPDTIAWLRSHLDEQAVRRWHADHAPSIAGTADDIAARLRHVLEHGSFEFADPTALFSNARGDAAATFTKSAWFSSR